MPVAGIQNDSVEDLLSKSASHLSRGQGRSSLRCAKAALALSPNDGAALHLAGVAAAAIGKFEAATALLERAVVSRPNCPQWIADLGAAQYADGFFHRAAENLSVAEQAMSDARTSTMAGHALRKCGRLIDATKAYRRALEMDPTSPVHFALGCALYDSGNWADALPMFLQYSEAHPEHVEVHRKLASIYGKMRLQARSTNHWRTVLALAPEDAAARRALPFAMIQAAPPEETLSICEGTLAEWPRWRLLESTSLMVRLHCAGQTRTSIRSAHEQWASRYLDPAAARSNVFQNERGVSRPLRIGYIGGEFWLAPSFFFLFPILSNHDCSKFEITLYDTVGRRDEATLAYRSSCTAFRKVDACRPDEVASQIRADRIDILVDLSGHYESQGLLVFGNRAAPIQVSYPNYPSTTGLADIDYILSDDWVCPINHEDQYTEHVHRLDTGYLTYAPPRCAAAIKSDRSASQTVTFGIFQRATKFNSRFWDAVAKILQGRRGSQLLIHFGSAELDDPDSPMRHRFGCALKARDVNPDRITFVGPRPLEEHLRLLVEADLALDTFPYNGQTTTCECLFLGVPVVTLIGDTHVSRVGWQLLARSGLECWATSDVDAYVTRAIDSTWDRGSLASLQRDVKEHFRNSSVLDEIGVTREIEEWYRQAWQAWLNRTV